MSKHNEIKPNFEVENLLINFNFPWKIAQYVPNAY